MAIQNFISAISQKYEISVQLSQRIENNKQMSHIHQNEVVLSERNHKRLDSHLAKRIVATTNVLSTNKSTTFKHKDYKMLKRLIIFAKEW